MASFIIGYNLGEWYVNELRPGQRALGHLPIFYREGRGPLIWVGTLLLEAEEAKTMDFLSIGNFIILSSTTRCLSLVDWGYGVGLPRKGMIYDETYFGPLSSSSAEPSLYNVMWINWRPRGSTRRGIGQIHRDGWELADYLERSIKLI